MNLKVILLLCIFILTSSSYSFRSLIDDKKKIKICNKATYNLTSMYNHTSLSSYVTSLKIKKSKQQEFILDLLTTQSIKKLKDFLMDLLIYLIMIGISFAFLLCIYYIIISMACLNILLLLLNGNIQQQSQIWYPRTYLL